MRFLKLSGAWEVILSAVRIAGARFGYIEKGLAVTRTRSYNRQRSQTLAPITPDKWTPEKCEMPLMTMISVDRFVRAKESAYTRRLDMK
jgi:hypothetical protein